MPTNILVFGAGAIGAFYGSRLAQNEGVNVSAVCRSNFEAVRVRGFSIASPVFGQYTWAPAQTFPNASVVQKDGKHWDYIIVSTKALPDVNDDSELLDGIVADGTAIVLIQNGIGIEEPYRRRFPTATILSAVTITSAAQPEQGFIKHHRFTRINTGVYPEDSDIAVSKNSALNELLVGGGIEDAAPYTAKKLQLLRWHKVAINAAFNPSSVLSHGTDNPTMTQDAEVYEHMKAVIMEVFHVAYHVSGSALPGDFATAEQILNSAKQSPSGSRPSMAMDWDAGRRMELEVILGNPIRMAEERGLAVPRLQTMYALLKIAQAGKVQQPRSRL